MQPVKPALSLSSYTSYRGYYFPKAVIAFVVWLYFRFPLSLRMVGEILAARGIVITYETVRRWANTFGKDCACRLHASKRCAATSGISTR